MATPATRSVTPRDKRAAAQLLAQQRFAKMQPPSPEVDGALKQFSGPPSPEEIAAVSMRLAQQYGVGTAVEFETYAKGLVLERARAEENRRLTEEVRAEDQAVRARRDAENQRLAGEVVSEERVGAARAGENERFLDQERARAAGQAYASGRAPSAATQQALHSFAAAPTEEQIRAKSAELARVSPMLAREFEAYARGLVADRAAAQEGNLTPEQAQLQEAPRPRQALPPPPYGGAPPPPVVTPAAKPTLLDDAKDILQGFGHIVTLGKVPAPEFIKRGAKKMRLTGSDEEEQAKNGSE